MAGDGPAGSPIDLDTLDSLLSGIIRDNREKVAGWMVGEPGCWGFLAGKAVAACRAHNLPVAILTRNARPTLDHVLDLFGITVDAIRTRDDGAIKPSPEPVHSICEQLGVTAAASWMVGDHLFDVRTGKAAGTRTVLFVDGGGLPQDTGGADHVVHRLEDLLPLVLGSSARRP